MQITNVIQNLQYGIKSDPATAKSAGTTDSLKDAAVTSKAESYGNSASISGADATIEKALEQAGLPKTEKNVQVARQLLENQMAVSKDNLSQLIRQSNIFREANISTLLLMNKNNIPITHFTAAQLQGYIDNQQNLLSQLGDAVGEFTELLSGDNAAQVNNEILELLTNDAASGELSSAAAESAAGTAPLNGEVAEALSQNTNTNSVNTAAEGGNLPQGDVSALPQSADGGTANIGNSQMQPEASILNNTEALAANSSDAASAQNIAETLQSFTNPLSSADMTFLSDSIKNLTGKEPDLEGKDTKGILGLIKEALTGKDSAAIKDLVSSSAYKELIKKAFGEKFTMNPGDVKDADSINNYYKSTFSALSKMMEIAQKNGETQLADKLSKPMDNVKFMDTINNVMPFIQLPLKFESGATHGELFVFKNGRNKTSPEDVKSVLLHLDMDSLGPTDIHMKLDHKHLNLKFYCNDNPSMKVLSDKIEDLADALKLKGFDISTDFSIRESKKQPMEEALSGSSTNEPAFVYGFDTRA